MTASEFLQRRAFGQIADDEPVRTIIWTTAGRGTEWAEVFIAGRYETIAQQEWAFRCKLGDCAVFLSNYRPEQTIKAKYWVAL